MRLADIRVWLGTNRGRKYARYAGVSLASVVAGQAVLAIAFGVLGWSARPSNYVAFAISGSLSYWLNRSWTWGRTGRSHLLREVLPFWLLALAGLVFSTWAVRVAELAGSRLTDQRGAQTLLVMAASLGAFGTLWVVKFVILDRFLFGSRSLVDGAERLRGH